MNSHPPASAEKPASEKLTSSSVCSRCDSSFRCGMVAGDVGCWCADLPLLAVPPVSLAGNSGMAEKLLPAASCFCPACLKLLTEPTKTKLPQ